MHKIPVGATISGAYRFLLTHIISIIGTLWLPLLVTCALISGVLYLVIPHAWWSGNVPPFHDFKAMLAALMPVLRVYPLIVLFGLVMGSMMLVGLMRHALGEKKTTTFVYFSLGAPVWRMAAATLLADLLLLLLMAFLVALFCATYIFVLPALPPTSAPVHAPMLFGLSCPMLQRLMACGAAGGAKLCLPQAAGIIGLTVLWIVELCVFIYASVRLVYFLPAVVVAEKMIGLGRSWSLGGGNFWRIFLVFLVTIVPVAILFGIAQHVIVNPVVKAHIAALPLGHHDFSQAMVTVFHAQLSVWPWILGIGLLQRIAFSGLITGAIGTAYKAVTATEK